MDEAINSDLTDRLAVAKAHYLDENFEKALADYRAIQADFPQCAEANHMLGLLAIQAGQYDLAKVLFCDALAVRANDPSLLNHLANVCCRLNEDTEAEQYYRLAMESDPNYPYSYNNLANLYVRQNRFDEAQMHYEEAITRSPEYIDAHYNLGYLHLRLNNLELARESFSQVIRYDEMPSRLAKVQYQLGHIAMTQSRFDDAGIHYEACLNLDNSNVEVRKYLGFACLKQNKEDMAIKQFSVYLNFQPDDLEAHYNLGVLLQQKMQFEPAFYHFQAVVKLDDNHSEAHNNLGVLSLKQKRQPAAIKHFEKALSLDPDNASIQYTLTALLGEQAPARAPNQFVEGLYDTYAAGYDQHMLVELDYQVPAFIQKRLAQLWPAQQVGHQILELGCGSGLMGKILKPYAQGLQGIDLSAAMLRLADKTSFYDRLHHGDFHEKLTEINQGLDLIISADALIYTGELQPLFEKCFTQLKPNGYLMFTCEVSELVMPFQLGQSGRYVHHPDYVNTCVEAAGFKVVTCQTFMLRSQDETDVEGILLTATKSMLPV